MLRGRADARGRLHHGDDTFGLSGTAGTPTTLGAPKYTRTITLPASGFTIGYWSNKNGQTRIGANYVGLCPCLAQFSNLLTLPASCTDTRLAKYVLDVIKPPTRLPTA